MVRPAVIQTGAVLAAILVTAAYLFVLYALTWFYCFGTSAGCPDGWVPRTVATAAYLAMIAALVTLTRWLLRAR